MENEMQIDYGKLRANLEMIGCRDIETVVEWFVYAVDEEDLMRQSGGCYQQLAKNLDRCYRNDREANEDSKQNACDLETA